MKVTLTMFALVDLIIVPSNVLSVVCSVVLRDHGNLLHSEGKPPFIRRHISLYLVASLSY
jgi:hypothetical protein